MRVASSPNKGRVGVFVGDAGCSITPPRAVDCGLTYQTPEQVYPTILYRRCYLRANPKLLEQHHRETVGTNSGATVVLKPTEVAYPPGGLRHFLIGVVEVENVVCRFGVEGPGFIVAASPGFAAGNALDGSD
jgi:hypothetical protein